MAAKKVATWFTCEVGAGWVSKASNMLPAQDCDYWDNFQFTFTCDPMKAHHFEAEQAKRVAWLLGGKARKFVVESDKFHVENLTADEERIAGAKTVDMSVDPDRPFKRRTFGWALDALKDGMCVYRRGWNGPGQHLRFQRPDENSKMMLPYIYIDTVQGDLVPWLASQTDMLADDWEPKVE